MLERSLLELVGGKCFSSDGLAKVLLSYLCKGNAGSWPADPMNSLRVDCGEALLCDIERDRPRQFRRDDLSRLVTSFTKDSLFISGQLPLLEKLTNSLMVRHGDYLHYRDTQVQAYARFSVDLDPAVLAAWHFCGWLGELSPPDAHAARRVLDHQTPFFAPLPNPCLPFAEGHVHLGGVGAAGLILSGQLLSDSETSKEDRVTLLRLRRLLSELMYIPLAAGGEEAGTAIFELQSRIRRACSDEPDLSGRRDSLPDWDLLMKYHKNARVGTTDWLLSELACRAKDSESLAHCWLWLLVYLFSRYRQANSPPFLRVAVLYLLVETMRLRRQLVMDNIGLSRFTQDYFANGLRRTANTKAGIRSSLRHLMAGSSDLLEVKGMPEFFNPTKISNFALQLGRTLNQQLPQPWSQITGSPSFPSAAELGYIRALEQWHFCAHFSRSAKDGRNGQMKAPDMAKLWGSANKLHEALGRTSGWDRSEFLGGQQNSHFRFEPAHWLRGLDVAGNENDIRIEWFSPIIRWLRSGLQAHSPSARIRAGFHLSIHAGEDYAHPLSGLRHVDETVRFCEMRDGDRLGHALSLGIDPKDWAEEHGDMVLPVDEHLDNLVWAWHHATLLSARLPLAAQVLPILERRIRRIQRHSSWLHSPHISTFLRTASTSAIPRAKSDAAFGEKPHCWISRLGEHITPELLFQAWLLRRNCHHLLGNIGRNPILGAKERCAAPDFSRLRHAFVNTDKLSAEGLYWQRHQQLALGSVSPLMVLIRVERSSTCHVELNQVQSEPDEGLLHDGDSQEEMSFMHALQDYLLSEYDRKGLIIEANPTSNVYISRISKHSEHPIFRWCPPDESTLASGERYNRYGLRAGPNRVLINTDDPGIMPTTLRTEYALLREAAIERGIARTIAEDWLERLRRYGVEQFHRHHQPVFTFERAC